MKYRMTGVDSAKRSRSKAPLYERFTASRKPLSHNSRISPPGHMMGEPTTAQALAYDTWFDTSRGAHAWAIEPAAVDEALLAHANQTIVEVGCGTGRLVAHLADRGDRVPSPPGTGRRAAWSQQPLAGRHSGPHHRHTEARPFPNIPPPGDETPENRARRRTKSARGAVARRRRRQRRLVRGCDGSSGDDETGASPRNR
jgi:hypothetical protein